MKRKVKEERGHLGLRYYTTSKTNIIVRVTHTSIHISSTSIRVSPSENTKGKYSKARLFFMFVFLEWYHFGIEN